jgi:hypothetical protein
VSFVHSRLDFVTDRGIACLLGAPTCVCGCCVDALVLLVLEEKRGKLCAEELVNNRAYQESAREEALKIFAVHTNIISKVTPL